jgi:hypothetical protein
MVLVLICEYEVWLERRLGQLACHYKPVCATGDKEGCQYMHRSGSGGLSYLASLDVVRVVVTVGRARE